MGITHHEEDDFANDGDAFTKKLREFQQRANRMDIQRLTGEVPPLGEITPRAWRVACRRWPALHAINVYIKRAPDIAQRRGLVYCKSQWLNGPEKANVSGTITEMGLLFAVREIIQAAGVKDPSPVVSLVNKLMPPCLHPDCHPQCQGGFLPPMTNEHPHEES